MHTNGGIFDYELHIRAVLVANLVRIEQRVTRFIALIKKKKSRHTKCSLPTMPEDLSRRWMEYDDKSATAVRRNLRSMKR